MISLLISRHIDLKARLRTWMWPSLYTAFAQGLIQALGLLSGLLTVRFLTPTQYAYYTIAAAGLGALTTFSDGGISSGVLAQGGAVWQDRERLGGVVATGLRLRMHLSLIALLIGLPWVALLIRHQGASWIETILVSASVVPIFAATASGLILETVPRLHQALAPLQRIQVANNLIRTALIGLLLPVWPLAWVAMTLTALSQWWSNLRMRRLASRHAKWRTQPDSQVRRQIVGLVKRMLPAAGFYALSGQLTVWLISVFGSASSVAAIGALGRLGMVFTVVTSVFSTLAAPRFSRLPHEQAALIARRYFQIQVVLAAACTLPLLAFAAFPAPILTVLGPQYSGLGRELFLMGLCTAIATLAGVAYHLGASRGIVVPPRLYLPYSLVTQICLLVIFPLNTVHGVLLIGTFYAVGQWLLHAGYFEWLRRSVQQPPTG